MMIIMDVSLQKLLEEDIMSGQYDTKDNFTVVLQPFLQETSVPFTDVRSNPPPPTPIEPGGTYAHSPSPEPPYLGKRIFKDIPPYLGKRILPRIYPLSRVLVTVGN